MERLAGLARFEHLNATARNGSETGFLVSYRIEALRSVTKEHCAVLAKNSISW